MFEQNTGQPPLFRNGDEVDLALVARPRVPARRRPGRPRRHDDAGGRASDRGPDPRPDDRGAAVDGETARRRGWGWLLLVPGMLWLGVFFLFPTVQLFFTSLYDPSGSLRAGLHDDLALRELRRRDHGHLEPLRALVRLRRHRDLVCLLLGYPLAYAIAFKAGRWKNFMLVLVIAPFFTSFLLRTLAWRTILSDQGPVTSFLQTVARPARGRPAAGDAGRGDRRPDLQLHAVHDAAAVRLASTRSTTA